MFEKFDCHRNNGTGGCSCCDNDDDDDDDVRVDVEEVFDGGCCLCGWWCDIS